MEHLWKMGEGSASLNRQYAVGRDTFIAMAALYQGMQACELQWTMVKVTLTHVHRIIRPRRWQCRGHIRSMYGIYKKKIYRLLSFPVSVRLSLWLAGALMRASRKLVSADLHRGLWKSSRMRSDGFMDSRFCVLLVQFHKNELKIVPPCTYIQIK